MSNAEKPQLIILISGGRLKDEAADLAYGKACEAWASRGSAAEVRIDLGELAIPAGTIAVVREVQLCATQVDKPKDTLWEGTLLECNRAPSPVKARIVACEGVYLDPIARTGPGLKFQVWNEREREWRAKSPHEIDAASLAMALAETNQSKR